MKTLETLLRFQHTKNGSRAARKARKKIKTIAGRLVRDITRKLSENRLEVHKQQLGIYEKVLHGDYGQSLPGFQRKVYHPKELS